MIKNSISKYLNKEITIKNARKLGVKIGNDCRFLNVNKSTFGSEPYLIGIGNHVTITNGVKFVTHDGGVWIFREENKEIDVFGKICIGNNVFIGINSIILPSVEIGDNVVIAAGSVVTKNIASNSVVGGNPAKFIKSVEEYKVKSFQNGDMIKGLNKKDKRNYLLGRFSDEKKYN